MREIIEKVKTTLDGFIEQRAKIEAMPHSEERTGALRLVNTTIRLCESMLILMNKWEEEPCEKS